MYNTILTILLIDSVLIIIAVLMQPAKTNNAMSDLQGGGSSLFTTRKSTGFDGFMQKVTVVLGVIFFACALILTWLSSH